MKNKELKIGILAVIVGVTLYFGFNFLKGEDFFTTTNKYVVYYENVDGLTISNPVIVNGFSIGRVKSIDLIQGETNRELKVVIDVRDDIPVGDSTIAILTSDGLLGGKAIVLKLGKSKTLYKTGDVLEGTTERSITEELEMRAKPVLNTLDTALHNFSHLIEPTDKESIHNMLKNMEAASLQLKLMSIENRRTFNKMGSQMNALMASFQETEKRISPLLDKMGIFTDSLNTLHLANTIEDVESAIANMNAILVKVNSKDGTIGMLMNDKELYNKLNGDLDSMQKLIDHIEKHPNYYFAPLGKKLKKKDPHWDDENYDHSR